MSDMPARLREHAKWPGHGAIVCADMEAAADQIERLECLLERSKSELSKLKPRAIFDREIYDLLDIDLNKS